METFIVPINILLLGIQNILLYILKIWGDSYDQ